VDFAFIFYQLLWLGSGREFELSALVARGARCNCNRLAQRTTHSTRSGRHSRAL